MSFLVALGALAFLMFVAYRGMSVILFAPIAALGAVLLTDPAAVPAMFTDKFMVAMVSFVKSYFPADFQGKLYLAGDGAIRDVETGYFTITGRIDDVLNVSGHRMGTMEIESALVAHEKVAEAAVVGRPDDLTGEAIVAFVVLKGARPTGDEAAKMIKELQNWVGHEIGPIAKPKDIRFGENLPKTRSGKIMRRLLRQLAKGEDVTQDTSTLENPQILEQLKG